MLNSSKTVLMNKLRVSTFSAHLHFCVNNSCKIYIEFDYWRKIILLILYTLEVFTAQREVRVQFHVPEEHLDQVFGPHS